jgi:hypothetical protein
MFMKTHLEHKSIFCLTHFLDIVFRQNIEDINQSEVVIRRTNNNMTKKNERHKITLSEQFQNPIEKL